MGRLVRRERRTVLGRDVGLETQRSVTTLLNLTPPLAAWLRPRATLATGFFLSRDPNARDPVRDVGDTAGRVPIPPGVRDFPRPRLAARPAPPRLGRGAFRGRAHARRLFSRLA